MVTLADSCPPEVRKLVDELYSAAVYGHLLAPPDDPKLQEKRSAYLHIDRRMREAGFMASPMKFKQTP